MRPKSLCIKQVDEEVLVNHAEGFSEIYQNVATNLTLLEAKY